MQTNLYDFLRDILYQVRKGTPGAAPLNGADKFYVLLSKEEADWLNGYLMDPGHEIHFKARDTGHRENGEPVYEQHYAIKGEGINVFQLIAEGMLQNAAFAETIVMAAQYFLEHVPNCEECSRARNENFARMQSKSDISWQFKPHDK